MRYAYPIILSRVEDIAPYSVKFDCKANDMVTLADIDFEAYRKANDMRPVKKTLSIPAYLNELGVRQWINFSDTLTEALRQKLQAEIPHVVTQRATQSRGIPICAGFPGFWRVGRGRSVQL